MRFYARGGRQPADLPPVESLTRAAPIRYRALCAGVSRETARVTGTFPAPPQPHRPWPVGRSGWVCLRCSHYERGGA